MKLKTNNYQDLISDVNIIFDKHDLIMTQDDVRIVGLMYDKIRDLSDSLFAIAFKEFLNSKKQKVAEMASLN
jgi:hypothetical protein